MFYFNCNAAELLSFCELRLYGTFADILQVGENRDLEVVLNMLIGTFCCRPHLIGYCIRLLDLKSVIVSRPICFLCTCCARRFLYRSHGRINFI